MKFKSLVCSSMLLCLVAQDTIEARWFSWSRLSPIVKAVKNVCFTHKKKFIAGGAVLAAAVVAYKKPSLLRRTLRFLSYPFRRAYDWIGSEEPDVSAQVPAAGIPAPAAPVSVNVVPPPAVAVAIPVAAAPAQPELPLQGHAGVHTAVPTWDTGIPLDDKPAQDWWTHDQVIEPRRGFFDDVVGQSEETFRAKCVWNLRHLFVPRHRDRWILEYPRRAALFSGVNDGSMTGIFSLRDLKERMGDVRPPRTRPYFSVLVYDPYLPWETDIRYLQSIPQNKDAVFQLASTFFGPLEGGMVQEEAILGNMFPHAVQGEEASAAVAGSTIWRKYIMPGTPLYLLEHLRDKFPIFHDSKNRVAVDRAKVSAYTHTPGDEDRVSVFIQDNAVVTSGYGDVEAQDHKGEGRQQRLEVYTHPDGTVNQGRSQTVSHVLTSALNLRNYWHQGQIDEHAAAAAQMLLNASYQATNAAVVTARKNRLYLTMEGGGAFANPVAWIGQAIAQPECLDTIRAHGLQVTAIYHPDKIRPDAKVARNPETDRQFFDSLLTAYDRVNGTRLHGNPALQGLIGQYLDMAYQFKQNPENPALENALHRAAQQLNSRLMWQPYAGRYQD